MVVAALQSVELLRKNGRPVDGLVSVANPPKRLPASEKAFIERTSAIGDVSHVFFRRFNDGRSSHPAAFVIDNSSERLTKKELAKLHNDLWLNGGAPLVYVAWPTQVDILSCARGPDFWTDNEREYSPAFELEIASGIAKALSDKRRFSANRLADGTFWDDPQNHSLADHDHAAHESLIQAIVETDAEIGGESNPTLRRLLLLVVLIKYLEDREVFPGPGWFGHFHKGARNFLDVLKSGDPACVLRLLSNLESKFNGDVFSLPSESKLTAKALKQFAKLVEAKTLKKQRYLWDQFSFSHVPVEVISHLYQRFVQDSTAVYTPPFLAALLLDFAMPYDKISGKERVLDPACGSGVFLVGAMRRLVNVWRSKNKWANPTVDTLKSILREQVFGVERDPIAVDLTAFSLALAVCDSLQPNVIWNELRFDRLRNQNVFEDDFFNFARASDDGDIPSLGQFDVVIGNPPFESEFSEPAIRVNEFHEKDRGSIPDKQIAYLFLDQALRTVNDDGVVCLIQPSGFLYNLNATGFRSHMFDKNLVRSIFDFTSIRGLYSGADTKSIAVLAKRPNKKTSNWIDHITFRRTFAALEQVSLDVDHYDWHRISLSTARTNPRVWRVNLVGGGRLVELERRWASIESLGGLLTKKGLNSAEGFVPGDRSVEAKFLTGMDFLPTKSLTLKGIDNERLGRVDETHFERPRKEEIYCAPLVLIREHSSLASGFLHRGKLAYNQKIVGIYGRGKENALRELQAVLETYRLQHQAACVLRSSEYLAGRATAVSKNDILSVPIPRGDELDLTFWELALVEDLVAHIATYVRRGQSSPLLTKLASTEVLAEFSELYVRMLGSIYDNLHAADPVFLDGLICQPFYFDDEPSVEWLGPDCEEHLQQLVFDTAIDSLRTIRVVRIYQENVIFIIKPDRLRYWIRSTAVRDADDTLVELQQQGF